MATPQIQQLVHADGWRAVVCMVLEGQPQFKKFPLIAWGLTVTGQVVPLVHAAGEVMNLDETDECPNAVVKILQPGQVLDPLLRLELEREVRAKLPPPGTFRGRGIPLGNIEEKTA